MEDAMKDFESMVGSAEQKLDNIEKKIDAEFAKQLDSDVAEDDEVDDQVSLLAKLDEVKAEYATLCQEAREVSVAQREMAKVFQQELMTQVHQLQALQDRGFTGEDRKLDAEAASAITSLVQQSEVAESLSQTFNKSEENK